MDEKTKHKIAAITITYNDGYKFKEWCQHYNEYKDELYLHIIVDNGSNPEYLKLVKEYFKESIIIERKTNGGCTISYNDGIRFALADKDVQYISLIGNDIKIQNGALGKCVELLSRDEDFGMVEPVILEKNSSIINDFGCSIDKHLFMRSYMAGKNYEDITESVHYAEAVTGGMNIATRIFYETVGLQDELLFMYSDEVDIGLRAKKLGFKMAALSNAMAWHQHINQNNNNNQRHPFSRYLVARNKTYLCRKHFGNIRCFNEFIYFIVTAMLGMILAIISCRLYKLKGELWQILGTTNGLLGNMASNKYSHL